MPNCSSPLPAMCGKVEEGSKGVWLLELAANNDVIGFKAAVEEDGANVNECGRWYCRQVGTNKMGVADRSPIMIAALFGSLEVLEYILAVDSRHFEPDDINKVCGADKGTVLQCAMASGASNTSRMVHLLLSHGADRSHLDSQGLCYLDLQIATQHKALLNNSVVTPSSIQSDRVDWENILPDSVSVTSIADLNEGCKFWDASMASNHPVSTAQMSSPKSAKVLKHQTLQDHTCDALSSEILKSTLYTTDEFRMYCFKVRPCSRAYSHDWTECPFVHPGENARRRDPRRFHYSCVPCPDFRKGACRHGDACEYAHGVFESWLHPAQYRTRLCKDGIGCTRKVCFFAHTKDEVRTLSLSTEYGGTLSGPLSPVDVASATSPGGAASPSAASGLVSFSPVTSWSHSSFASSDKALCDTWTAPSLPALSLPEGAQATRLRASLSARDMSLSSLPDAHGQLLRELASLSVHARLNAAVAVSSCSTPPSSIYGKHQNLLSTRVEDVSLAGSPRSPPQVGCQFSPRLVSNFHDTGLAQRAASTAASHPSHDDPIMSRCVGSPSPARQRPLCAGWGSPTGKAAEWGVSGHDLSHFRSSLNAARLLRLRSLGRLDATAACAVKMG